jgi:hypothetical protein
MIAIIYFIGPAAKIAQGNMGVQATSASYIKLEKSGFRSLDRLVQSQV